MNNKRRKEIRDIINRIADIKEDIDLLVTEEQESFDNLPESFQMSERGERIEECIEGMDSTMELLDESIECLESIIE